MDHWFFPRLLLAQPTFRSLLIAHHAGDCYFIGDALAAAENVVVRLIPVVDDEINRFKRCHAPEPQNQPRFPAPFDTEISVPVPALIAAND